MGLTYLLGLTPEVLLLYYLTQKDGKFVSIRAVQDSSSVEKTVQYLEKIVKLVQEHPGCKITILEIPVYSIVNWNQSHRHKDPSKES
jgi:hypothetical protein